MRRRWVGGWITSDGVYRVDRWVRGERIRCSTGCKTIEGARVFLAEIESGVRQAGPSVDFAVAVADFLPVSAAQNTAKYVRAQGRSFDLWLAHLGGALLDDITPDLINEFVSKRRFWGVGVAATNRDLAAMSKLFAWARSTGRTTADPFSKVHQQREHQGVRPHREVPREELLAARGALAPKWADAVTVLYGTAFRWGSFARLRVGSVDQQRQVLRDPTPKGKRAVEVPVSGEVMEAAIRCLGRSYPQDEGAQLGRRLGSACTRAGVPRFTGHDIRVSAATWMSRHGTALRDLQELLGHASMRTTERYVRAGGAIARGPI